jgi:hypothetical protein
MRNYLIIVFTSALLFFSFLSYAQFDPEITEDELRQHINFLASDNLEGRYPGTEKGKLAASYISERFMVAGLTFPYGPYQYFKAETGIAYGENFLKTGDTEWTLENDYVPFSFSSNSTVNADVVFCGYGFDIEKDNFTWDDYSNVEVENKWVLVLRGVPDIDSLKRYVSSSADDRDKALTARDNGAAGILLVSGYNYSQSDSLVELFFDKSESDVGIPVFNITREVADEILRSSKDKLNNLEIGIGNSMTSSSFEVNSSVDATAELSPVESQLMNVVGEIKGNDEILREEYIVIGAHYDHLGFGGPGSGSRSYELNQVHNGADDNASGVAAVIELAGKLSFSRENLKRSILFVAFDGEELGLLGSKHFVNARMINNDLTSAMINFDMIGRLSEDNLLFVGGTGTSKEAPEILESINNDRFKLSLAAEGYGPSDHAAFYSENIPVFFISTGAHSDYHTPDDDVDKIDFEGERKIIEFTYDLVMDIANRKKMLTFQESGPKERERTGYDFKVTLGIMPDFTSGDNKGLRVDGVREGGPAGLAGMMKGDVITALEGKEIKNIYDYMARLKKLSAGQTITVDVIRDGQEKVLIVQL